jgi:hypothetical protein
MKRTNHKSSAVLSIFSILTAFLMLFSFGCVKKEEKEIRIGAILPLTGDAAQYGGSVKKGVDLAITQINSKGGIKGRIVTVFYEDSKLKGQRGRCQFKQYIINDMPRQARLDAPGVLHHVMARGIEQCSIFRDDRDREDNRRVKWINS